MNEGAISFRSMSLAEDLNTPARFIHYRPTRRNVEIVRAVSGRGSTMVIAPYGSGKSLAAGVAAMHVRNDGGDRRIMRKIARRFDAVDAALGSAIVERSGGKQHGKVVILTGLEEDPLANAADQLGLAHWPRTAEALASALQSGGWDHVAIIWDEFGRHLEGLVAEGRSDELDLVQRLAERAVRSTGPTISLTLLLHQNLLAYASRLNETTRTEWRKIEGRFRQARLVEDSQEAYRLIADVVSSMRPESERRSPTPASLVDDVVKAKWLDGMADGQAVAAVLEDVAPLTPGALQVLPMLVARVGQNERSLFSFLREVDLARPVDVEVVYAAFSDAMRTDVGIGGAYRRWLETESARSRAANAMQRQVLAAACLLQLGMSGERRRLPRAVLELAVGDGRCGSVAAEIDALVDHKLLLWRHHNDDVAVWHGADVDVALRVREERDKRAGGFDVKSFLEERFAAPYVRPSRHNARYGVNRFFAGVYQTADEVGGGAHVDAADQDAAVVYVIANDRGEIDRVRSVAKRKSAARVMYVVPDRPLDVAGAAIEVLALEALKGDAEFIATDPMVVTELDELMSVAFEQLATVLRGLLDPRGSASTWYACGRKLSVSTDRPASVSASDLFDAWYPLTPRISNDQLMRNEASRTMLTARIRVVGATLERFEQERLGYEPSDRSAEGSIYRTVLEHTGLHRRSSDPAAEATAIGDEGLSKAWSAISRFFWTATEPGRPRRLAALTEELSAPPLGVPRAVMPLLIAAGYKRFARTVAIYRDGSFVDDLLGFQFDRMVMEPECYLVRVVGWEPRTTEYLVELCYSFIHRRPNPSEELIMAAVGAVRQWTTTIADGARKAARLERPSRALLRAVLDGGDPVDLVLDRLPKAFGLEGPGREVIGYVERARKDIDAVQDAYASSAVATTADVFRAGVGGDDIIDSVEEWASCFDIEAMDGRPDLRVSDKAVLRKAVETANGRFSAKSFAGSLSSILLQRGLDKWDDRTDAQFRTALRECRERIEAAALDTHAPQPQLRPVIEARMAELQAMLVLLGDQGAASSTFKAIGRKP